MQQTIDQLPLGQRVRALAEAVTNTRASLEGLRVQEASYLDHLARAEAEVTGKAPGWEGVELSGLIEDNPYISSAPTTEAEGDLVSATGESSGDEPPSGSAASPASAPPSAHGRKRSS